MFISRIQVERAGSEPAFTPEELGRAKTAVLEICRDARFSARTSEPFDPAPSGYSEFVACEGKDSEQDTVSVSGQTRNGRREIIVTVADFARGEPLPSTREMLDDLRIALEQAFPESHVEVTRNDKSKLFGP
jgi:hypothetical protein